MKLTDEQVYLMVAVAKLLAIVYSFVKCLCAICELFRGLEDGE